MGATGVSSNHSGLIGLLRRSIEAQIAWSHRFDRLLPKTLLVDGNREFLDEVVPGRLRRGIVVYDVGGGKNPVIGRDLKCELGLRTIGLDVDPAELAYADSGAYDETVCADICDYEGRGDADLVICQALLEHVPDASSALRSIASLLKPGGRALLFVPSRNALYARLNLLLPRNVTRKLLSAIFGDAGRDHGFRAYYDRCTPQSIERLARQHGLAPEECRLYFESSYFRVCFPLYAAWRAWLLFYRRVRGAEAAETFTLVLRRQAEKLV